MPRASVNVDLSRRSAMPVARGPYQAKMETPFCVLGIRTESDALAEIRFLPRWHEPVAPADALAEEACRQIGRYIGDPEYRFRLPLRSCGTPFQRRVWRSIADIRPGCTETYGTIAAQLHSAAQAVGQACGANPFPLVIPCHRVVARMGLGGFANRESGFLLSIKRWLLEHEQRT
jgi:methylated-DNA-[protein]-cysteine S-methyltransferase